MLRDVGIELLVDLLRVGVVLDGVGARIGIAAADLPVFGQGALQFEVDTLAADFARGFCTGRLRAVGHHHGHGAVFLVDAEQRHAGIQRATKVFAFDANLIIFTDDGLEWGAGCALFFLRREDVAVAHVYRMLVVQVVDQAGVAGEVAGDLVVAGGITVVVVVPVQASAEDQLQRVGQAQAAGQVETVLGGDFANVVGAGEVRFARIDRPVEVVRAVVVGGHVVDALAGAHHQFMGTAERLERAAGKGVEPGLVFIVAGLVHRAGEGVVGPARLVGAGEQGVLFGIVGVDLQAPVVGQALAQLSEHGVDFLVLVLPIGAWVIGARQAQVAPIQADHRSAPEVVGLVLLVRVTEGQGGVFAQVGFGDGIEQAMILLGLVDKTVGIAVRGDDAAAPGATVIERAGGVELATVIVPAADGAGEGNFLLIQWPLADQVDGGRRVACAGYQAGSAAHHFDAVEHCQVRLGAYRRTVVAAGDTVIHEVVDIETACGEGLSPRAVGVIEEQPRRGVDHVVDAGHGLVIHALARDHGDGLRGFAQGQRQFGRGLHRAGGVRLAAFGGCAKLLARDLGSAQLDGGRCFGVGGNGRIGGC